MSQLQVPGIPPVRSGAAVAIEVDMPKANNNRLSSIAARNGNRVRDAFFAACVALAATVSFVTVTTTAHAAHAETASVQSSR